LNISLITAQWPVPDLIQEAITTFITVLLLVVIGNRPTIIFTLLVFIKLVRITPIATTIINLLQKVFTVTQLLYCILRSYDA
jgi:hypothetical protein